MGEDSATRPPFLVSASSDHDFRCRRRLRHRDFNSSLFSTDTATFSISSIKTPPEKRSLKSIEEKKAQGDVFWEEEEEETTDSRKRIRTDSSNTKKFDTLACDRRSSRFAPTVFQQQQQHEREGQKSDDDSDNDDNLQSLKNRTGTRKKWMRERSVVILCTFRSTPHSPCLRNKKYVMKRNMKEN